MSDFELIQKNQNEFPSIFGRPDLIPQIYPSKFADCKSSNQVYEKIMKIQNDRSDLKESSNIMVKQTDNKVVEIKKKTLEQIQKEG